MHNAPPEARQIQNIASSYWSAVYAFHSPLIPYVAKQSQLPFRMDSRFLRSPERGGLRNLFTSSSRILGFGIRQALHYSYCRDLRFVLLFCGMLGFGIWWALAPDPLESFFALHRIQIFRFLGIIWPCPCVSFCPYWAYLKHYSSSAIQFTISFSSSLLKPLD